MLEENRIQRNEQRLTELFPSFATRIAAVIRELEDQALRPRIQAAWRSPAKQREAFKNGTSQVEFGFHNVVGPTGTKQALAVDLLDDDAPLTPSTRYLLMLARAARNQGLRTGILWGLFPAAAAKVEAALATGDISAQVEVGWDPTHIEPTGITIAEAKAGKRPS